MRVLKMILYVMLMAAVLVLGWKLESKLNEYRTALDIKTERTMEVRKGRKVDFAKLKAENPDTKGWIWLPDTNIDYPIVQGKDNDYYLHRDFSGNYLYDGCIYIDASVERPFSENENTVIYGHRMRSGAMFNNLGKYSDREFFDTHRTIFIETEGQSYDLHVIAFCSELSDSALYTGQFRDDEPRGSEWDEFWEENPDTKVDEPEVLSKAEFIDLVREKAENLSDEEFGEDDVYVTLSTCTYSDGEWRDQVIGILKEAPMEERIVEVRTEKPLINKWLAAQILVGAVMLAVVILPVLPTKKRKDT